MLYIYIYISNTRNVGRETQVLNVLSLLERGMLTLLALLVQGDHAEHVKPLRMLTAKDRCCLTAALLLLYCCFTA